MPPPSSAIARIRQCCCARWSPMRRKQVDRLPLMSPAERHRLLYEWNATDRAPRRTRIHQLFETQAAQDTGGRGGRLRGHSSATPSSTPAPTGSPIICAAGGQARRPGRPSPRALDRYGRRPPRQRSRPAAPMCRSTPPIPPSASPSCSKTARRVALLTQATVLPALGTSQRHWPRSRSTPPSSPGPTCPQPIQSPQRSASPRQPRLCHLYIRINRRAKGSHGRASTLAI